MSTLILPWDWPHVIAIVQMDLTHNTENTESCNRWKFTEIKAKDSSGIIASFWSQLHSVYRNRTSQKQSYRGWNHRAWCIFFLFKFWHISTYEQGQEKCLKMNMLFYGVCCPLYVYLHFKNHRPQNVETANQRSFWPRLTLVYQFPQESGLFLTQSLWPC